MHKIRFSPEAANDLEQTKNYITEELGSESSAIRTVSDILGRIRTLGDFPQIGAPLSSIVKIDTDYRFLVCGNYTAFYRVDGETVFIIRVLYGKRNFMEILFGRSE